MRIHLHDVLPLLLPAIAAQVLTGDKIPHRTANTRDITPAPLVIPPSQYWDGVDGQWSTFALRIGTPAQNVRVIISTNSPETLVVLPPGCTTVAIKPVPDNCANARGGLFNLNSSSTWLDKGFFGINKDGVGLEANLGYSLDADYGLETVGLGFVGGGSNAPTLENQTVAGFGTKSPFYIGAFGLGTQPVNYSTIGNFSTPSYFSMLRSQNLIPSLSWSYTAGAKYRLKSGQYGQLIFGGSDGSRFTPNTATFSLDQDVTRDIVVAIQSITYSGTTQETLLSTPTFAFIESTDPNIWLPEAACRKFEEAFGLSIDKSTGLYLINATHHSRLLAINPEVTFTLANSLSGGETANIVLPYSAFSLSASYPFTPNSTFYFPLKKAANDSQNTLGRAFLQEAYLTVDYERGNFSVSQCAWNDGATPQLNTILSPSYITSSPSDSSRPPSSKSASIGSGTIAGAAIAGVAGLAIVGGVAWYFLRRRKRASKAGTTDEIALTNVDQDPLKHPRESALSPHSSSYLADKKLYNELYTDDAVTRSLHYYHATGELATGAEIHQLPANDSQEGDYMSLASHIEAERRAASTPQIDGTSIVYELHGSEPTPSEMGDESSQHPRPPQIPNRTWTSISSRSTSPFPGSPFL